MDGTPPDMQDIAQRKLMLEFTADYNEREKMETTIPATGIIRYSYSVPTSVKSTLQINVSFVIHLLFFVKNTLGNK